MGKTLILSRILTLAGAGAALAGEAEGVPTFTKDIAPIFFDNCVSCHRPNHLAPMSLMTYEDSRPWARAVKMKVESREMPPWGAAAGHQTYANDASLSTEEISTIAAWVDGGTPKGNDADLPATPQFTEGWSIGEPDLIFTMVEPYVVPADGSIPYTYITTPTGLTEDIWISANEFKPGDRRVIHHVISQVIEGDGVVDSTPKMRRDPERAVVRGASVGGYVPNRTGRIFTEGTASMIPAGAEIEAQMHYTTIGEVVSDVSSWGVVLAKAPEADLRKTGGGIVANGRFVIPPQAANHEVKARREIDRDTYLTHIMPHMHVRGKSAKYTVVYPDGTEVVALDVPAYDFEWQLRYELAEPILMPKGSALEVVMHFDNSPNNRHNPDPTAQVRYGDQTWEEMMIGFYTTLEVEEPGKGTTEN